MKKKLGVTEFVYDINAIELYETEIKYISRDIKSFQPRNGFLFDN